MTVPGGNRSAGVCAGFFRRWGGCIGVCFAVAVALASNPQGADAAARGAFRLSLGTGADSNVTRDYLELGAEADALFLAILALQGRYLGERVSLGGNYEGGARVFATLLGQHEVVQALSADASV